jgi:hypothetical protein
LSSPVDSFGEKMKKGREKGENVRKQRKMIEKEKMGSKRVK